MAVVAVEVRVRMRMVVMLVPDVWMATVRMLVRRVPRGPWRIDACRRRLVLDRWLGLAARVGLARCEDE